MKQSFLYFLLLFLLSCSTSNKSYKAKKGEGDTRTKPVQFYNQSSYLLTEYALDSTYAFSPSNPVKVGGVKSNQGPYNERMYLNALVGPEGQTVKYFRAGSCCHFKTPNGFIDNGGLLDKYRVYWTGSKDTLNIYINMYDEGDLRIPLGLKARGNN